MAAYRHMNTGSRIVLHTTDICLHINIKNTSFLLCAPYFDLLKRESQDQKWIMQNFMRMPDEFTLMIGFKRSYTKNVIKNANDPSVH